MDEELRIITSRYIMEKYPKCNLIISETPVTTINNKNVYASIKSFNSLEEFELEFINLLNGFGYLIICENETIIKSGIMYVLRYFKID